MGTSNACFKTLVVITPQDCQRLIKLYPRLIENIIYGDICFVGRSEVGEILNANPETEDKVRFIDEESIIPFDSVHRVVADRMKHILNGRELPRGITGWYYQQFLKMQYAFLCEDQYYMTWDGDTIPCRKLDMFMEENGKPFFDLKHEFHKEYFDTMGVLLPGFTKAIGRSFISEHMLFNAEYMKELIAEIENNTEIPGIRFWEKILHVIPEDKIQSSAFSEFETYGTFVAKRHSDAYALREWHSFRLGGEFFSVDTISDRDFLWLAKDFDAISFEKGHTVREDNANLFDNPYYQEKLTPKQMLQAAQMEFKEGYKEVWEDDEAFESANESCGQFNDPEEKSIDVPKSNRELMLELRGGLQRNPAIINNLPVDDIISCVYLELYGLRQLYDKWHFERLEKELGKISDELAEAKEEKDCSDALCLIDKLLVYEDMLPDSEMATTFIEKANFYADFLRHIRDNTLVVIGDSHVNFFSGNEKLSFIPIGEEVNTCIQQGDAPISVLHFGPCLAYKSNRYGSTNRFREKLDWALKNFILPDAKIMCVLGEVDLRVHVFKQVARQGKDYKTIIDGILDNYMEFLIWLKGLGHEVLCWGPIASQNDSCPETDEYPRTGTTAERNKATEYFNDELCRRCGENEIGFLSLFSDMLTEDMQTNEKYLSEDRVHLGQFAYPEVVEALRGIGVI
ncbi:MAG: hypothetical protein J5959_04620 [Butyrivibrio sp.]|nr:hypothetical protein [Butyrivibrio sp.]